MAQETIRTMTVLALAERLLQLADDSPDTPVMVADAHGRFHPIHDAGFVSVELVEGERPILMAMICEEGSPDALTLNQIGAANEGPPN